MASAVLSVVAILLKLMRSCSTHCCMAKCLMSISFVCFVGWPACAMRRAPWLSSYSIVACSCSSPICARIVRRYRMYLPASAAAMNSASVELWAMTSWYFVLYRTVPPAMCMLMPVTDLRWVVSDALSEST